MITFLCLIFSLEKQDTFFIFVNLFLFLFYILFYSYYLIVVFILRDPDINCKYYTIQIICKMVTNPIVGTIVCPRIFFFNKVNKVFR